MNKQDQHTIELFSKAFHEVVPPLLENLATKDDIARIERKLDMHEDRMDRHGTTLDNHEKRITDLEVTTPVVN